MERYTGEWEWFSLCGPPPHRVNDAASALAKRAWPAAKLPRADQDDYNRQINMQAEVIEQYTDGHAGSSDPD